jgi:DNA polymerase-3 subunit alpha
LDGAGKIEKLIQKAKAYGQNAMAITDHGVLYGVVDFYERAVKCGIKPIIGCEVYVSPRKMTDKIYGVDGRQNHLILLAKNNLGYNNLKKIVSKGFTSGFYYKPRVDYELLKECSNGLIVLSGCMFGEISRKIIEEDFEGAKNAAQNFRNIFGENFYLEIQDHGIVAQKNINENIIKIGKELDIEVVATNDVHYVNKEDAEIQDILFCVQTGKFISEKNRMKFETDEFYLKSEFEMFEKFFFISEALENTQKIADMCDVQIKSECNCLHMPVYKTSENESGFKLLKKLCEIGFLEKYENSKEYLNESSKKIAARRLKYELDVINSMNYVDYFLIVWDFVKFAKDKDIFVGPGRGSSAGSIVSYCLNITTIDPVKYDLIFERFLNCARSNMPDIDIDFCYIRRQEVIDYVINKYGREHVANIITFGTMGARQAIRDVGRVFNMSYDFVDSIAKYIPDEIDISIDKAISINENLKDKYENDIKTKKLIDIAKKIEGFPRHVSTHAAGIIITKEEIFNYVPVQKSKEIITTQFSMNAIEKLGLLKIDFLGLRTLTVIRDSIQNIKRTKNVIIDIEMIDLNDEETYDMIADGDVVGLFQLEGNFLKKQFLKKLKPSNFEELIAAISLYRPGPMDSIDIYIKNKNSKNIKYKHSLLENILCVTYGCIVYQEQVMEIVQVLAGFSLEEADLMRRTISKKDVCGIELERNNFVYGKKDEYGNVKIKGAMGNGIDKRLAEEIFDEISKFASYAFNKSHAAAYAKIAFITAWLKQYFRAEFMAALLDSVLGKCSRIIKYANDCKKNNINILPPDINKSFIGFTVDGNDIRFGLSAIKHVGENFSSCIINEREEKGDFLSFSNFCRRILDKDLNKRAVEWCIKCGCFDCFGKKRSELLNNYEKVIDAEIIRKKNTIDGQIDIFGISYDEVEDENFEYEKEFSTNEISNMEKEALGIYVTFHPLERYKEIIEEYSNISIAEVFEFMSKDELESKRLDCNNDFLKIFGVITKIKTKMTRSKNLMAIVTLEDLSGEIDVLVFPNKFVNFYEILVEGNIVILKGKADFRDDIETRIVCEEVQKFDENIMKISKLYIRINSYEKQTIKKIKELLSVFPGDSLIYFYFKDKKRNEILRNIKTSLNNAVIGKLKGILGEENVKIVQYDKVFE